MKLVKGFVIKTVGGKCVAVATGEAVSRFKGMIVLNDTAEVIFRQLMEGDTTAEAIAVKLTEEFDITKEQAKHDVDAFIEKLSSINLFA